MTWITDHARRAWQLCEQGHAIEEIAEALGCTTNTAERWLLLWEEISQRGQEKPWWYGLDGPVVSLLRYAGIRSRADLVKAWKAGDIQNGRINGIGPRRQQEVRWWLEETREHGEVFPPKAMLIELSAKAELALLTLQSKSKLSRSQIIDDLLLQAVEDHKDM